MRAEVRGDGEDLILLVTDLKDLLGKGTEASPAGYPLHASTIPGVYAFTTPDIAGWEQLRPVPGGICLGTRFLPEEFQ